MKKLIVFFFILNSLILFAQEQESAINQNKTWFNNGIDPFVSYVSIAASNVSGGLEQKSEYAGQLYTGLNFDFEKMLGWNGTRAKISLINRHGSGLSHRVGSVFEPLNVVGGQSTFFYDLSIEKDFGNHFSFKVGRTTAADDFSGSKLYSYSLSNTINGVIRTLLFDGVMSTFPFPTWGARLKYKPSSKHQLQLGAYQLGKNIFNQSKHGLDFAFRSSDDLSIFIQYDWFGKIGNRATRVYLGTHQAFGSFANFDPKNESDHFMRLYGHMDIDVTNDLNTFITMAYSHQGEIAKVPFQSSFGLNWKGLVKSRLNDRLLFFATVGSFSNEWANLQEKELSPEVVLELGYRFQLTNNFVMQPSVQYDLRPGGSGKIDNAVIPGILIEANF